MPDEKLAQSLETLRYVARGGVAQSSALSRTDRERLLKSGCLREVIKGWLVVTNPAPAAGEPLHPSWRSFVTQYLAQRFGDDYCLSAEASVLLQVGSGAAPRQITVVTTSGSNQTVSLPFEPSLLLYRSSTGLPEPRVEREGLWMLDLPAALCRVATSFFRDHPDDAEMALRLVPGPAPLLRQLLARDQAASAGRLAGALGFLGELAARDEMVRTMRLAGFSIRAPNPFARERPLLKPGTRVANPPAGRIKWLWGAMRDTVERGFPSPPGIPRDIAANLTRLDQQYHAEVSLANPTTQSAPDSASADRGHSAISDHWWTGRPDSAALEARGYSQAIQAVRRSAAQMLEDAPAAESIERDHREWYRELFAPSVQAGLLPAVVLAGYRDAPAHVPGSRHIPPAAGVVADCMEALFDCLKEEQHPGVRAVLGHFLFHYIHPFPDGNVRVGGFVMNVLLAAGGYPWIAIRRDQRESYRAALDTASMEGDILPLTRFLAAAVG
ncbi:MAG TPA: Fic family protein [Armatimonadota bacterium]|nr:Fic family protein [Armatimonadota bacterium]